MATRRPRWVYAGGTEPDPRFSLANERTYLAWMRTALALFATGVALKALNLQIRPGWQTAAATVFVLLGLLATIQAWVGWARTERAMRLGSVLRGPSLSAALTVGVGVGVLLVVIGMWSS